MVSKSQTVSVHTPEYNSSCEITSLETSKGSKRRKGKVRSKVRGQSVQTFVGLGSDREVLMYSSFR